jgi:hypothetical protein
MSQACRVSLMVDLASFRWYMQVEGRLSKVTEVVASNNLNVLG